MRDILKETHEERKDQSSLASFEVFSRGGIVDVFGIETNNDRKADGSKDRVPDEQRLAANPVDLTGPKGGRDGSPDEPDRVDDQWDTARQSSGLSAVLELMLFERTNTQYKWSRHNW
jgi:hypothetical protein